MNRYKKARGRARRLMVEQWQDFFHALRCPRCGLRPEALALLHLVDWTETEFLEAAAQAGPRGADGAEES